MGIKDNFSQAVKELWKKDGKDGDKKDGGASQPSELDKYLRSEETAQSKTVSNVEVNSDGVPLETPYYRNTASTSEEQKPKQAQTANPQPTAQAQNNPAPNAQTAQNGADGFARNAERPQYGAPQQPYNQNVQNARRNFAQDGGMNANADYDGGYNGANGGFNNSNGGYGNANGGYNGGNGGYGGNYGGSLGGNPPMGGAPSADRNETDEITIISKNTMIDGNVRSLANMQIDGNIKGNVETTRNIDMSGKIIGDVTCNNAGMISAAMQGNISLKGRMRMDRDTILIGDLSSQYADINGRIRGKLDVVGKAELKRDAVVFGDINASTIAVTDGAIIQGYVNTTFLSKEDSRNVFPDAISIDSKEVKS